MVMAIEQSKKQSEKDIAERRKLSSVIAEQVDTSKPWGREKLNGFIYDLIDHIGIDLVKEIMAENGMQPC